MTSFCYYSATATELTSLSLALQELKVERPSLRVWARTQTQLFDQARVEAFVKDAVQSQAVIIGLLGGLECFPAWESVNETLTARRAAGQSVPHLHIQPWGGGEDALAAAHSHSDGLENGIWRGVWSLLHRGGALNAPLRNR
jgi:cobaltochelatase CobN